jgi:hypothetical protein
LGTCFHAVVEAATTGRLAAETGEAVGMAAREMFDQTATTAYGRAHELLRVKYRSVEVLPYYYLFRERAALIAQRAAGRSRPSSSIVVPNSAAASPRCLVETMMTSRDGLLFGRPDCVDLQAREIVDYKTGAAADEAGAMSPAEARQLRLYVHLALENDHAVQRGVIVRPGGRRAEVAVTRPEADAEGLQAREALAQFNRTAGHPFAAVAEPSTDACRFCPCIPFCEPFWRDAVPAWLEDCGTHIEGLITVITESQVQNIPVLTFDLQVRHGTVGAARAFVEQVPESWTTTGGCPRPVIGNILRIVHGRATSSDSSPVIRVDRALTAVWTVPRRRASTSVEPNTD